MKVIKPFIRSFKGVPIYISWFVIYKTRFPVIKTRALEIKADIHGTCVRRIMPSIQKLDPMSFYGASLAYLNVMFKGIKKFNPKFFEEAWIEVLKEYENEKE